MTNNAYEEFQRVAAEYCKLIEIRESKELKPLLYDCLSLLSELVNLGTKLPAVHEDIELAPRKITHEDWGEVFGSLVKKLGRYDRIRIVFDSYKDKKAMDASLADDLADVYRDLKNGLLALEAKTNPRHVLWQWRLDFWTHWGRHAVDATKAIYSYLSEDGWTL